MAGAAAEGGWLSPNRTFDQSLYSDSITQQVAKIASEAQVFRYDGSDLMPTAVGGGSFWKGMVEWLQGAKTSQEVCDEIVRLAPDVLNLAGATSLASVTRKLCLVIGSVMPVMSVS